MGVQFDNKKGNNKVILHTWFIINFLENSEAVIPDEHLQSRWSFDYLINHPAS